MDTLYRIQTENTGRKEIAAIVSKYFQGFTITETLGYYKGKPEASLTIDIVATCTRAHVVRFTAEVIRQYGKQECVLLTEYPTLVRFI